MGGVGKGGLVIGLLSILAGCSTGGQKAPEQAVAPAVESGRCDASGAQFAVGQQATKELLEQARARSGSLMARTLGPNDAVTLDYRSERLNLNTDAAGKVIRANCG